MGDEVSLRTKKVFEDRFPIAQKRLDDSIEKEKEKNDFLSRVPVIVEAIRSGKIHCRVYRKDKFHAKAYITHARQRMIGSTALVGSSNFTYHGMIENIELNIQISGRQVNALQEAVTGSPQPGPDIGSEREDAEEVTPEILRIIERHTREYLSYDIYAKSLMEFFRGHEMTVSEWEYQQSEMYRLLDQYQRDGYHALMQLC